MTKRNVSTSFKGKVNCFWNNFWVGISFCICVKSINFFVPVERSSSPGSLLLGHAQGGFLDMVDFHTFLQDVLETGGIDMGMYLFDFGLRF